MSVVLLDFAEIAVEEGCYLLDSLKPGRMEIRAEQCSLFEPRRFYTSRGEQRNRFSFSARSPPLKGHAETEPEARIFPPL